MKIKLDSKATTSKICVPSHNRWMIRCTNLDLAGSRRPLSIARRILGSLVMLFEAQHGKYGGGGECAWSMDTSVCVAHMSVNTVDYVYSSMRGTRPLLCNNTRA